MSPEERRKRILRRLEHVGLGLTVRELVADLRRRGGGTWRIFHYDSVYADLKALERQRRVTRYSSHPSRWRAL